MDYRALRSQFGVVLQESFLFVGSVRQNIVFCNPDLAFHKVIEAAALQDSSRHRPHADGLRNEDRAKLSGGQRQRLSLARAMGGRAAHRAAR